MTILVQSFLNSATRLSTTATTSTTVAELKTIINAIEGVSTSVMEFYIKHPSTTATVLVSGTLGSYGITTATTIYSSNTISTSTSKVDRQLAKLELAQLRRQAGGNTSASYYRTFNIYDVDLLADKYTSNTTTVGTASTLVESRPWTDQAYTIPSGMDRNEPYIYSGTYKTAAAAGIPAYSLQGTKYTPAYVASVTNETAGLYRRKYVGNFNASNGSTTFDMSFFTTPANGPISQAAYEIDEYVSFGQRGDLPFESGYSFEWKGYLQVPITGDYNTHISCDDNVVMWIGDNALPANITSTNYHQFSGYTGGYNTNANSIALTTGVWYPVRIWFTEYGGAERFQLYMSTGSNIYNGEDLTWAHNSATKGY